MQVFAVDDVEPGTLQLEAWSPQEAVAHVMPEGCEVLGADSRAERLGVARVHGFVDTVAQAFSQHLPLVLAPDDVWLMVAQGAALSQRSTEPSGPKTTLQVRRDDFRLGADNPWPEVFSAFSQQIGEHLGPDVHGLYLPCFSTTGPLERACCEVVLMGALKNRFEYEFISLCGIPEVRLLGTPHDWRQLRAQAETLCAHAGLRWWWKALRHPLSAFVDASEGRADRELWRSFFKLKGASGGPYVTGWINVLLPFLEREGELVPNPATRTWREGLDDPFGGGPGLDLLPSPLTCAPVTWRILLQQIELDFVAGFLGVDCLPDGAVRPALGWGVLTAPGRR